MPQILTHFASAFKAQSEIPMRFADFGVQYLSSEPRWGLSVSSQVSSSLQDVLYRISLQGNCYIFPMWLFEGWSSDIFQSSIFSFFLLFSLETAFGAVKSGFPSYKTAIKSNITGNFEIFLFVVSNPNSVLLVGEPPIISDYSLIHWNAADWEIPSLHSCQGSISSPQ